MSKRDNGYQQALEQLQLQLAELNRWIRRNGKRVAVIFEGRDAAGKGGTIKRITESMDTRDYRIVALPKPTPAEATQWYFQRYISHLPAAGELVLFDRSWYNRAVVEPAMGFCTAEQTETFLEHTPVFEKLLTDDGIILVKYWLAVDQEEQEQRFKDRAKDPLKRWKLSPVDIAARKKYREIGRLRDTMIERTHTVNAPWFVVDFNDQKRGRVNLMRHLLTQLPHHDEKIPAVKLDKLKHKPRREEVTDKALWVPDSFGSKS